MLVKLSLMWFDVITWIMERDQSEVIQSLLGSVQGCFQDLGGSFDDLHQVVVHGAGHIKHERQGGCALGDVLLLRGPGPRDLSGCTRH